ncbi:amino acid ABC transporter permease [Heliobacterium chlorum]|uniref:Amino acid ABC transporter permease n=1 Tax=Heliobacterium chlorum TaxID=2698 RepID=A0ABR7T704_HELCL|nr:amino acid ABC transporter permease [Heliobacterium chlorum]MBC9786165.1 amino acid ABC transporter permease [Heliobacterium chlorum]
MEASKWMILFEPKNLKFLMQGLQWTIELALVSIALSLFFGMVICALRISQFRFLRYPAFFYIESLRNLPLILLIFFTYFALPVIGVNLSKFWAAVVAFTIFTSALVAEIIRGGIQSIPKGQWEAARSQGFTYLQTMVFIIMPQALRKMIPPLLSQFITLTKDTSYATIIGLQELTGQASLTFIEYNNPIQTLLLVACIYFIINFAMSRLGRLVEQRMAMG